MIVAIDTAGPWVCVARGELGGKTSGLRRAAEANHNEMLPALVAEAIQSVAGSPSVLAVTVGPGTFTGTRVGVAFVAGWGQSLGVQVLPVSTFEVAAGLADPSVGRVKVALPLVRGIWGVSELTYAEGRWREGDWGELSTADLDTARRGSLLVCPWGDYPADLAPPGDWNPAATLVHLAGSALPGALVGPRQLSVRYLGTCQAERRFHARQEP